MPAPRCVRKRCCSRVTHARCRRPPRPPRLRAAGTNAQLLTAAAPQPAIRAGAGGAAAASPAAAGPCALGINFFPTNGENKPTGWTQAVQQNAGNTANDQMIKIALAGYPIPQLYMAPVSVFTQVNGQIPAQCLGGAPGVLTRPAAFTVTYALAGAGGVLGPFTKGSKQDPPANVTLKQVPQLPDVSCEGVRSLALAFQHGCRRRPRMLTRFSAARRVLPTLTNTCCCCRCSCAAGCVLVFVVCRASTACR